MGCAGFCHGKSTRVEDGSIQDGVGPVDKLAYVNDYHMTLESPINCMPQSASTMSRGREKDIAQPQEGGLASATSSG